MGKGLYSIANIVDLLSSGTIDFNGFELKELLDFLVSCCEEYQVLAFWVLGGVEDQTVKAFVWVGFVWLEDVAEIF